MLRGHKTLFGDPKNFEIEKNTPELSAVSKLGVRFLDFI